jgi:intein-encoded DNA endonuclease-like protein
MFLRGFFDAEWYVSPMLNHKARRFDGIELGAANTNDEYLNLAQKLLSRLGISSRFATTHAIGDQMIIRGRVFVRRKEVRQLRVSGRANAEIFYSRVGFAIPEKKEKLLDLIGIIGEMTPADGYRAFTSQYQLRNHRWHKSRSENIS